MELGPRPKSIYKKSQWDNYIEDLKNVLVKNALTAEQIVNNSAYKEFISNYVEREIVGKSVRNAIIGVVHKLSNMEIKSGDRVIGVYPIVNEYKGHDLTRIWYFAVEDGQVTAKTYSVIPDKPIILLP